MIDSSTPKVAGQRAGSLSSKTLLMRLAIAAATFVTTAAAGVFYFRATQLLQVAAWLQWSSNLLFLFLFGWITFSFWMAVAGLCAILWDRRNDKANKPPDSESSGLPSTRTAILMPVYNESIGRVIAGVRAMIDSLQQSQRGEGFDVFILSDSTKHECWLAEEFAFLELREQLKARYPEATPAVYYRHRSRNIARKAGNIADFCTHWGASYDFMIVLDADSLIDGQTVIAMRDRMAADPALGILQVPPVPIGRESLFARLQQFAAQAYGAVFARGYALWSGSSGNYWGHNAIIRIAPFCECCNLPVLPGEPPLGGEILSHDFVEAALMLRAEYKVEMANDLGGSYEECPTTLADYLVRDQRWCQGNMQHFRLIFCKDFRPLSRFHFINGFLSYAMAPLWILFVLLTLLIARLNQTSGAGNPANSIALTLFLVSMAMLLLPKMFGVVANILTGKSVGFGGVAAILGSAIFEMTCSIIMAPIIAVFYTRFVIGVLRGKNVKWSAQQRDEHRVTFVESCRQFGLPALAGIVATILITVFIPSTLGWILPMLFGLLLAVPVAMILSSRRWGQRLRDRRLLLIPEEVNPPEVVKDHQQRLAAVATMETSLAREKSLFEQLVGDREQIRKHCRMLREVGCDIPVDENLRRKIEVDFDTPSLLDRSLSDKQKFAVLSDRRMMEHLGEKLAPQA